MFAVRRSYLYVPGNRGAMLAKALGRGADALIVDLEDAVPVAEKDRARELVAAWLRDDRAPGDGDVWIRIDPSVDVEADVALAVAGSVTGIVLPKSTLDLLGSVTSVLARHEDRAESGGLRVIALIETARGVVDAETLAMHDRVVRLGMGEADLAAELRLIRRRDAAAFLPLRSRVVVASAAAGISPPIGPAFTALANDEGLRSSTSALRDLGFGARTALHPDQLRTINEVFSPTDEEVSRARELLSRFDEAVAEGHGAFRDGDGRMIDEAVVRSARETLEMAAAIHDRPSSGGEAGAT